MEWVWITAAIGLMASAWGYIKAIWSRLIGCFIITYEIPFAQFLRNIPEHRFCLVTWADDDFKDDACGTTACAMGWATTIFDEFELIHGFVAYKDWISWGAVNEFFEIDGNFARDLFSEVSYDEHATPLMVSEKIRKHLLDKPALAG